MTAFIGDNFLLQNELAVRLYHDFAKDLPIIDYHNHLDPILLAKNHRFANICQLWVSPDQYKHRAMRINGIDEMNITGKATDWQKFLSWARTFPKTIGNPLFHWSCLELKRVFTIDDILTADNAEDLWQSCNNKLVNESLSSITLLQKWNVELLCTSDDLLADLTDHKTATQQYKIQIRPSLRGDHMLAFDLPGYQSWISKLEGQTNIKVKNLDDFEAAVELKLGTFHEAGCLLADHALDAGFVFEHIDKSKAKVLFDTILQGHPLNDLDLIHLRSYLLTFLSKHYAKLNWRLQLHIGAQRKTSSRLLRLSGGKGGFAAIGTATNIDSVVKMLDGLEREGALPKIILYNLNPSDNAAFASLTGSFAENGVVGKIQFGPAWWYNDHFGGIRNQLKTLANYSLLHHTIGMTTDSRSILSLSRHEYYRRILCDLIAEWVTKGHVPKDEVMLGDLITAVCYDNAKNWITTKSEDNDI